MAPENPKAPAATVEAKKAQAPAAAAPTAPAGTPSTAPVVPQLKPHAEVIADAQKTLTQAKEKITNEIDQLKNNKKESKAVEDALLGTKKSLEKLRQEVSIHITVLKDKNAKGAPTSEELNYLSEFRKIDDDAFKTHREAVLAPNFLRGAGNILAKIGDGLGYAGGFLANGIQLIWQYTLSPLFASLKNIGPSARSALKKILGRPELGAAGAIAAAVVDMPASDTTPEQAQKELNAENDFKLIASLAPAGTILTLNAGLTAFNAITQLNSRVVGYKGMIKTNNINDDRNAYVIEVFKAESLKNNTNILWSDFLVAADKINAEAKPIYQQSPYNPYYAPPQQPAAIVTGAPAASVVPAAVTPGTTGDPAPGTPTTPKKETP